MSDNLNNLNPILHTQMPSKWIALSDPSKAILFHMQGFPTVASQALSAESTFSHGNGTLFLKGQNPVKFTLSLQWDDISSTAALHTSHAHLETAKGWGGP